MASLPLRNGDLFWQVRTGEIALSSGRMPDRDSYSYTIEGARWNNHEWIPEVLAAALYRAAGWGGFRLFLVVFFLGISSALTIVLLRRVGVPLTFLVLVFFLLWCKYKMLPAPQALSLGMFLAAFLIFRGRRLAESPLRWAFLALWMLVWGNTTAESIMFLPFVVLDQVLVRLSNATREAGALPRFSRHASLLGLVCVLPFVNPPWSSVFEYATAGTLANRSVNEEFLPLWASSPLYTTQERFVTAMVMLVFLAWAGAVLARSRERWQALRDVSPGLLAVVLALLFQRNLWLMVVPTARLACAVARWAVTSQRRVLVGGSALVVGACLFASYSFRLGWSPQASLVKLTSQSYRAQHLDKTTIPVACVEALEQYPAIRRVYTVRLWASYIIWRVPRVKVYIDGRNLEYPESVFKAYVDIWDEQPDALALLDASRTDAVIAFPEWGDGLGVGLNPWQKVMQDGKCALFVRRSPLAFPSKS